VVSHGSEKRSSYKKKRRLQFFEAFLPLEKGANLGILQGKGGRRYQSVEGTRRLYHGGKED